MIKGEFCAKFRDVYSNGHDEHVHAIDAQDQFLDESL